MGKIGLKLADGAFYPVMDEGRSARKRLVVTTVADGQRSVQIDIYRGEGGRVADSGYVGSLVIENIPEAPKGEPDIRLELGLAEDGTLSALAQDPASGEHQSLRISLESLAEEEKYEIPDFEFEEETDELPASAATPDEDELLPDGLDEPLLDEGLDEEESGEDLPEPSKTRKALFIALVAALFIALALAFSFFVYRCSVSDRPADSIVETEEAAPAAPKPEPPKVEPAPPAAAAIPAPIAAAEPAKAAAPPAIAPSPPAAAEPPKPAAGVRYRLRWGDTLWDLAYAYYRNPWLYPRIAKANGIKNPDRIIAGRTIVIPPR